MEVPRDSASPQNDRYSGVCTSCNADFEIPSRLSWLSHLDEKQDFEQKLQAFLFMPWTYRVFTLDYPIGCARSTLGHGTSA
jgi:hypothetical protein